MVLEYPWETAFYVYRLKGYGLLFKVLDEFQVVAVGYLDFRIDFSSGAVLDITIKVEGVADRIAPYVIGELRIVDIRVAVALHLIYRVVAVHLFFAHRVLLVPF